MPRRRSPSVSRDEIALARWQGSIDAKLDGITKQIQDDHGATVSSGATILAKIETVEKSLATHTDQDAKQFKELAEKLASSTTKVAFIAGGIGILSGAFASSLFQALLKKWFDLG